jgi:leader peptidase (prepilin peptidase)/N-methyltransferase
LWNRLGGAAIGGFVILTSMITSGKIGLGDGILLCITGLGLGFWGNLELFCLALSLAAGLSIMLLIFRLADRKKSIPFVPFLFVGYLILIASGLSV